ncbi:hypothetical protein FGB62_65g216 [Gracilaria domingensis]|nr:hypothetical protein FGB62_65g216 [Gracilaria domingensis]
MAWTDRCRRCERGVEFTEGVEKQEANGPSRFAAAGDRSGGGSAAWQTDGDGPRRVTAEACAGAASGMRRMSRLPSRPAFAWNVICGDYRQLGTSKRHHSPRNHVATTPAQTRAFQFSHIFDG